MSITPSEVAFRKVFTDLKEKGKFCSPRGQLVIEIENYSYTLPPRARFCNFLARKINQNYVKREFLWYLRGNAKDLEILKHASMWDNLVNDNGSINSNYGQYIFNDNLNQFSNVVKTLSNDVDSRRASISILSAKHLLSTTNDVPCTYSLNFRIREMKLNMTVHMRSQDAVFGMGNDAPCFSFIHEMVYVALRSVYPELVMGEYHHFADSFHVYERHFKVMEAIAEGSPYVPITCPEISSLKEVNFLRRLIHFTNYGEIDLEDFPDFETDARLVLNEPDLRDLIVQQRDNYEFSTWLTTFNGETK